MTRQGLTARWPGKIAAGGLALLASAVVTAVYHLGYPEFRGPQVMLPVFGVSVMSLAYVITRNPLSAVLSHVAMHVAAVLYGLHSVVQLPPHY
jgi:membrane protease YdiL (CAAX protease family)